MQVGVSISMTTLFRGVQQPFSNVAHYRHPTAITGPWEALVDEIVAIYRDLHSADVNFTHARLWSSGGTPAQNEMLFQKPLALVGNEAGIAAMDRERAVLIRWPAGKNVLGRPVYLRKWFHSCGNCADQLFSSAQLQNTAKLTATNKTAIQDRAEALREIGLTESWFLCSETGRETTGQAQCHDYLEHHQLGDQWRL